MKRYELYDYSGFDWLGETPSHWNVLRMCYMFKPVSIKNTSGEINLSVYRDYGVIPTDSRDDNHNVISEDTSNYKLVEKGDFVMNKMKCWMGSLGLSDYRGIVSPSYTVMKPLQPNNHKFTHYLLRSKKYIPQYKRLSYGVREGQWDLRFEDFRELPCLIPPLFEQQQIVSFLDTKTSLIDSLIKKTQRKIELLKEKRTSLINEVVTKGLNPNVEMNDSGIEWIGEIPSNWEMEKIKFVFQEKKSIRNLELNSGSISFGVVVYKDDNKILESTKESYQELLIGEFLINPLNLNYDLKSLRIGMSRINVVVSQGYIILILKEGFNQFYYEYLLRRFDVIHMKSLGQGVRQTISFNHIKDEYLVIPSIREQQQIVEYLDEQTQLIDKTISIEEKRIELLREYRQSLISEVVTGKLKVTTDE